jgi:hypothetical protein
MTGSGSIAWLDDDAKEELFLSQRAPSIPISRFTLSALNKRNRIFWHRNAKSMKKRILVQSVLGNAMLALDFETATKPVKDRNSFERLLSDCYHRNRDRDEPFRRPLEDKSDPKRFERAVSSKGGSARKSDELHELLCDTVGSNLGMSQRTLLYALKQCVGKGVIVSVDVRSGEVRFIDGTGIEHRVVNLKDRLSRIKEEIDSR